MNPNSSQTRNANIHTGHPQTKTSLTQHNKSSILTPDTKKKNEGTKEIYKSVQTHTLWQKANKENPQNLTTTTTAASNMKNLVPKITNIPNTSFTSHRTTLNNDRDNW